MILAFDVSLRSTGVALFGPSYQPEMVRAIQPKNFGLDRYRSILREVETIFERHRHEIKLVVFEGYPYFLFSHQHQESANFNAGNQVFGLAGITEMIKMKLHFNYGLPFACLAPNSIKLFATGNGRAKKAQMIAQLKAEFGLTYPTNDEVDAYWIGLMGSLLYQVSQRGAKALPPWLKVAVNAAPHRRKALQAALDGNNPEGTFDWHTGTYHHNLWNRRG